LRFLVHKGLQLQLILQLYDLSGSFGLPSGILHLFCTTWTLVFVLVSYYIFCFWLHVLD